jgi:hypothetical protein
MLMRGSRGKPFLTSQARVACALIVLLACGSKREQRTDPKRMGPSAARIAAARSAPLDSLRAAQLAIKLSRDSGVSGPLKVSSFQRDSAGFLIMTSPTSLRVFGGETLVRVHPDGRTEIVERYQ